MKARESSRGYKYSANLNKSQKNYTDFKEKIGYSYKAGQLVLKEPSLWTP
jgi:hypothetical protein